MTATVADQQVAPIVRATLLAIGNYGTPIFLVLLVRNVLWKIFPTRLYSRAAAYCALFLLALMAAPGGFSLASLELTGAEITLHNWLSTGISVLQWGFSPAVVCVYICNNLDNRVDEIAISEHEANIIGDLLITLGIMMLAIIFTAPAISGIESVNGIWSVEKQKWVALIATAIISFSIGLVSRITPSLDRLWSTKTTQPTKQIAQDEVRV
jgi:hypothetical protein